MSSLSCIKNIVPGVSTVNASKAMVVWLGSVGHAVRYSLIFIWVKGLSPCQWKLKDLNSSSNMGLSCTCFFLFVLYKWVFLASTSPLSCGVSSVTLMLLSLFLFLPEDASFSAAAGIFLLGSVLKLSFMRSLHDSGLCYMFTCFMKSACLVMCRIQMKRKKKKEKKTQGRARLALGGQIQMFFFYQWDPGWLPVRGQKSPNCEEKKNVSCSECMRVEANTMRKYSQNNITASWNFLAFRWFLRETNLTNVCWCRLKRSISTDTKTTHVKAMNLCIVHKAGRK